MKDIISKFNIFINSYFHKFEKKKCTKCGSKNRSYGEYTRAWNDYCKQAAGEFGYYCKRCGNIDFNTPDFLEWLEKQPRWIVIKHGDNWRTKTNYVVQPT